MAKKAYDPGKLTSYCKKEAGLLTAVSITGVLYNVGMAAGPWFEGQLVQRLVEILGGQKEAAAMTGLALTYLCVIAFVQFMRFLKRLYVRKFANRTAQAMRRTVYRSVLVGSSTATAKHTADAASGTLHAARAMVDRVSESVQAKGEKEKASETDAGSLMTRAIADADDCAEGLRKFITEIFDTGVVIVVYMAMLFSYDWRLTLLVLLFPPIAYALANYLKKYVVSAVHAAKDAGDKMRARGLDRVSNAVTYRIYGAEAIQTAEYDKALGRYEQAKIRSGILNNATQPIYYLISSIGFIVIIFLGGRNVLGTGWTAWDIAAFSAYFACFGKLAKKSSHAANLFNAIQKAEVSWKRILPYMHESDLPVEKKVPSGALSVSGLTFGFEADKPLFSDVTFSAEPGQIVGITGPVACGKTTFARCFLGEIPYEGSIRIADGELSDIKAAGGDAVSFTGHSPDLLDSSIENNIALGDSRPVGHVLSMADFTEEAAAMPEGVQTVVGSGGGRLSGGQAARISLARALYHERPVIVLDDPFSAVDAETEGHILNALKTDCPDSIILLISHRLRYFPDLDLVLYLEDGKAAVGTHEELMQTSPGYRKMYELQEDGHEE